MALQIRYPTSVIRSRGDDHGGDLLMDGGAPLPFPLAAAREGWIKSSRSPCSMAAWSELERGITLGKCGGYVKVSPRANQMELHEMDRQYEQEEDKKMCWKMQ